MNHDEQHPQHAAHTVPAPHRDAPDEALDDVLTDPALDDSVGADWTDEGGATPSGPATKAPSGK